MKIYEYVRIDIETGEILEEKSFEYEGPIAKCGGGGGSKVEYEQSPEQQLAWQAISPMLQEMYGYGITEPARTEIQYTKDPYGNVVPHTVQIPAQYGKVGDPKVWDVPQAPSPVPTPQMGQYVDPSVLRPTADWYGSLSPEVMGGLWAPYEQAGERLLERMGAQGMAGNIRGGYSGQAQAAMGTLAAEAAKNVGLQAWQMNQPAQLAQYDIGMQNYRAAMGRTAQQDALNQAMWHQQIQAAQFPYTVMPGLVGGTYSQAQVDPAAINPAAAAITGGIGGAASGAMIGAQMGAGGGPYGAVIGGGLGALGGLLSAR
jgi:hypothetical protein